MPNSSAGQSSSVEGLPSRDAHADRVRAAWEHAIARYPELFAQCDALQLGVSERTVAATLGLANIRALRQELRRRRLPSFRLLRDWYVLVCVIDTCVEGVSLSKWASRRGSYPMVYYRFAERVCGRAWSEVADLGPVWARERALVVWDVPR